MFFHIQFARDWYKWRHLYIVEYYGMDHVLKNFERSKLQFRCLLCFSHDYFFTFSFESTDLVSILSLRYFRFASFLFTFPFFCVYSQTRSL